MGNPTGAFGLQPVRTLSGSSWNASVMKCYLAAASNDNIFLGDPVVLTGTADPAGNYPTVGIASAGATNPIFGVVVAFEMDPTKPEQLYRTAAQLRYVYVAPALPTTIFQVRTGSAALAITDVGNNAVLNAGGGGSTVTGFSSWYAYITTTPSSDATYQLLILGVSNIPNNLLGAYCVVDCLITLSSIAMPYDAHASAYYGIRGI